MDGGLTFAHSPTVTDTVGACQTRQESKGLAGGRPFMTWRVSG